MSDVLDRLKERLTNEAPSSASGWEKAYENQDNPFLDDDHATKTWRIVDDDGAAWASRKLQAAHREVAKVDSWAEREKARIDRVAEEERRSHERDIDFFQTHLALWLRDLIANGRTKKSLSLPGGKIQLRARQPKLNIENEEHLLDYLRGHYPDLVKVKESVNLSALKKAVALDGQTVVLADSGEVLSDVWAEPQEDSISFSPATPRVE